MTPDDERIIKAISESKKPLITLLANLMWLAEDKKKQGTENK